MTPADASRAEVRIIINKDIFRSCCKICEYKENCSGAVMENITALRNIANGYDRASSVANCGFRCVWVCGCLFWGVLFKIIGGNF